MTFEFRTMSGDISGTSNTALGSVVLAFTPNPVERNPANRQALELYDGAVSVKPSQSALCAVECDPKLRQFVMMQQQPVTNVTRSISAGQSLLPALNPFLVDWGKLWVAVEGVQGTNVVLGELWVTYNIEVSEQRNDYLGCAGTYEALQPRANAALATVPIAVATPMGDLTTLTTRDNIGVTLANTGSAMTMTFAADSVSGRMYRISYAEYIPNGAGSNITSTPGVTYSAGVGVAVLDGRIAAEFAPAGSASTSNTAIYTAHISFVSNNGTDPVITLTGATTGTACTEAVITIHEVNSDAFLISDTN